MSGLGFIVIVVPAGTFERILCECAFPDKVIGPRKILGAPTSTKWLQKAEIGTKSQLGSNMHNLAAKRPKLVTKRFIWLQEVSKSAPRDRHWFQKAQASLIFLKNHKLTQKPVWFKKTIDSKWVPKTRLGPKIRKLALLAPGTQKVE